MMRREEFEPKYSRFITPWSIYKIGQEYYIESAVGFRDRWFSILNDLCGKQKKYHLEYYRNNGGGGTFSVHALESNRKATIYVPKSDIEDIDEREDTEVTKKLDLIPVKLILV